MIGQEMLVPANVPIVYVILTIVFYSLMVFIMLGIFGYSFIKKGEERISYIRSFKKGKFTFIYPLMFPLFLIGYLYDGENAWQAFFKAVESSVSLITVKLDITVVGKLAEDFTLYKIAIYTGFLLVIFNTIFFVISIIQQHVFSFGTWLRWNGPAKERVMLIGNNEDNKTIYRSIKGKVCCICRKMTVEDEKDLFIKNYRYISGKRAVSQLENDIKRVIKRSKRKVLTVIINTESDEENMAIGMQAAHLLNDLLKDRIDKIKRVEKDVADLKEKNDPALKTQIDKNILEAEKLQGQMIKILNRVRIFVFGDPQYSTLYDAIETESLGCIHYQNKYMNMAADFVEKYPISQFMTEDQIDYETSFVKDDVNINVIFVGFGNTNREIFLASLAGNQFIKKNADGTTGVKKVTYHIFSNRTPEDDIGINRNYYRYKKFLEEKKGKEGDYLPLPELPAEEIFYDFPADSEKMLEAIKQIPDSKSGITFFVIAHGTDIENVTLLQNLRNMQDEEGWTDVYFFVKVRGNNTEHKIFEKKNCYVIGNEEEEIYNYSKIVDEVLVKNAINRNKIYDASKGIKKNSEYNWYLRLSRLERESNIYCVMALRSKLGMMGINYITKDEYDKLSSVEKAVIIKNRITKEEFFDIYAKGDLPEYKGEHYARNINYTNLTKISRRLTMAIQEHLRWNAHYISRGYIPASIREIKEMGGKSHDARTHGCLTNYAGLVSYRKLLAVDGKTEEDTDVIRYDYQILDSAFEYLSEENGCIIYKR